MHRILSKFIIVLAGLCLTVGCKKTVDPVTPIQQDTSATPQPQRPSPPEKSPTPAKPGAADHQDGVAVKSFLQKDSFCRDVLNRLSLTEFLKSYPSAQKDTTQSLTSINYAVYLDSMFMYEFLDGELFTIRYVVPRSAESATKWIAPYREALGPPTNTMIPDEFREMNASYFLSWDLIEHNLRINFAYLPPSFAEADLDLFGQFINRELTQQYLARKSRVVSGSPRQSTTSSPGKTSAAQRGIQNEIADPTWGRVAATVNRLCSGHLSDEERHIQILKTINLARSGKFSPEFTLHALQQAEAMAIRLGVSPVLAVQNCQKSLAFAAASKDLNP